MNDVSTCEGKKAKAFCLPDQDEKKICLKDLCAAHKMVVVYFYPKDLTSGCTQEAQEFSALKRKFSARKVGVVGISKDEPKRHRKFIEKEDLNITLLSDETFKVLEKYDVWKEKSMYGRKYMGIMRETFLVDGASGRVVRHWQKVKLAGHAQEVLDAVIEYNKKK